MVNKPLIFSTHTLHPEISAQLDEIGVLNTASKSTQSAIINECLNANYIVVRAPIAPEIIERGNELKAVVRHGAGLDMIPVDTCTQAGVLVANVPGVNAITVAEHVVWTTLALMRKFPSVNNDLRHTGWEAGRAHSNDGVELSGKTIGIIGMGNIGKTIARITIAAFDVNILTVTRTTTNLPDNVHVTTLPQLLKQSDVIVLSCPLNDETRGMLNDDAFKDIKQGAFLINVSRGPVVVESALINALEQSKLAGAALDVFDEHPLADKHPFFSFDNLILTPHMAGITTESMLRMGQGVVDEIKRIESGELPKSFINPEVLPLYNSRFQAAL